MHFSKTVRPEKDRDIVVGMLTAVQGFIREAFAKGSPSDLRMLDFGDRRILIFKGSQSYLALVVRGRVPLGLTGRMRRTLVHLEQRYQAAIERWNGSVDSLAGADDLLLEGLLGDEMRQVAAQVRVVLVKLLRIVTLRRVRAEPKVPAGRTTRTDPRVSARKLMDRAEMESFKDEYRDMMGTMLQEIRDGRLTLAGFGNLYVTMALQKSPRSSAAGWWELMLRTVREVLRTWPWDPETQAWVMPAPAPAVAEPATPSPAPAPAPFAGPRPREAGGGLKAPAVAEIRSDSG